MFVPRYKVIKWMKNEKELVHDLSKSYRRRYESLEKELLLEIEKLDKELYEEMLSQLMSLFSYGGEQDKDLILSSITNLSSLIELSGTNAREWVYWLGNHIELELRLFPLFHLCPEVESLLQELTELVENSFSSLLRE